MILGAEVRGVADLDLVLLVWRFGLGDGVPLSLEDVAARTGWTREQIRWAEAETLRRVETIARVDAAIKERRAAAPGEPATAA